MDQVLDAPPTAPARPTSESEWGTFVDSYGRAILDWLRQAGLSSAEAESLARDLLRLLANEFAQIVNEPSVRFRAWLQYAGHAVWGRLMESRVADGDGGQSPLLTLLLSVEAHNLFLSFLDAECSRQRRRETLPRVAALADPTDWEAFYMNVLESRPAAEVAVEMESPELAVHAAVFRVGRLLRQELQQLEQQC